MVTVEKEPVACVPRFSRKFENMLKKINKQTTLLAPKVNERLWVCEPNPARRTKKKVFPVPGAENYSLES